MEPKFTKEELLRYSRQLMLENVCVNGQLKLKHSRVLVIGAGGLGCPVLQYLGGAGVGTLGIADFDTVELHNLHRQILYSTEDVGKLKARVAATKIKALNPNVNCLVYEMQIGENNAKDIISEFDLVVDGSDNFLTRYLVNDICTLLNKPLVYGSVLNFDAQLAVFNYQSGKNLRDIYPEPPDPEDVPSCSMNGILGVVPGILGLYMANATLQIILGSYLNNGLFLLNLKSFDILKLAFDPA